MNASGALKETLDRNLSWDCLVASVGHKLSLTSGMAEAHIQMLEKEPGKMGNSGDFVIRGKEILSKMQEDADIMLRCTKGKRPTDQDVKVQKQIEDLTNRMEQEKGKSAAEMEKLTVALESTQRQLATHQEEIGKLKGTEAQINNMKTELQKTTAEVQHNILKAVGAQIDTSHTALQMQIKQEASESNKSLSDIQHMVASMLDLQNRQQLQLSSQRFQSTSTVDTVDTGFCEAIQEKQEDTDIEQGDEDEDDVDVIPHYIRDIGLKMETVVHQKVRHLARHLGIDHQSLLGMRDDQNHRKDYQNLFWDVVATWCHKCRRENKRITLDKFLQAADDAGITREVKPMPHTDRYIIEKNVPMLAEKLIIPVLLVHLRGSGLLCPDDVNYITECSQQIEKVTRLVDILSILGDQALDSLIKALKESDQAHIAEAIIEKSPQRFPELTKLKTYNGRPANGEYLRKYKNMSRMNGGLESLRESMV